MKILIFLAAVIVLLGAFAIKVEDESSKARQQSSVNKPVTINWSQLQEFSNYTGATFGQAQLSSLITYINNASNIYGGDVNNNLKYIKTVMDAMYGDLNNQYSVAMEYVPVRDFGGATIYCQNGSNYAYVGYGVNLKYPTYTYLVYRVYAPGTAYNYLNNVYGRGSGLTAEQGLKIQYIIQAIDGTAACSCGNTYDILMKLQNVLDARWNVICQSTQQIFSYVAIANTTWTMLKPQNCNYFIYAI